MFNIDTVSSQQGRIAIVTGANIGLGFETTKALARKGATVIMACRNQSKAEAAKRAVLVAVPEADLHLIPLDLSSLSSVRAFVETFSTKFERLDLLINNAGVMMPPYSKTEDGFELQMGTNFFGHFLLTGLLLDIVEKTPNSRIVQLSSIAHRQAQINFNDLNSEHKYVKWKSYGQSKLASLIFAYELDRRLKKAKFQTLSVAAHPGVSSTNLVQHMPKFLMTLFAPISSLFMHDPIAGAQPTLLAALGDQVQGGDYFGPTQRNEMKGPPGKVSSKPQSHDTGVAAELWKVAEQATGIRYNF